MTGTERPVQVRVAGRLLWGLLAAGVMLAIAGVLELNHLNENLAVVEQKSTFLAEAERAAARMHDSSALALGLGIFDIVGALVFLLILLRGWWWGRVLAILFTVSVAFMHVMLILQDGAIGVKPYTDMSHNLAEEQLINHLIVAPGYFVLLYPGETAGLILAVLIGWRMFADPTIDYFQQRRPAKGDRVWDVSEVLAKRQNRVS